MRASRTVGLRGVGLCRLSGVALLAGLARGFDLLLSELCLLLVCDAMVFSHRAIAPPRRRQRLRTRHLLELFYAFEHRILGERGGHWLAIEIV
jgi:hypothetical protein